MTFSLDAESPGDCAGCGGFHLVARLPGEPGPICRWCRASGRLKPPEPGPAHEPGDEHCGVGGAPKPDHPHYRRCSCGRWYAWNGSIWRPGRPSREWLQHHGLGGDIGDFMSYDPDGEQPGSAFGEFFLYGGWRAILRAWLRR